MATADKDKLLVLWTSGDPLTARHMVFMYTINAKRKGWFKEVTLLVWGASSSLLAQGAGLQEFIAQFTEAGVRVIACRRCAEELGVAQTLADIGVEVFYTGELLTEWLHSDGRLITI